jgi:hypothetical protein
MTMPTFPAADIPNAADFGAILPLFALKTGDQHNDATTTLTSDSQLFVSMVANASYTFELFCRYSADASNDFKWQFALPAGAVWAGGYIGLDSGSTTAQGATYFGTFSTASTIVAGGIGSGNIAFFLAVGRITTSSTAGNATFQFAQNATGAPNICISRADSHLALRRVA